MYIYIYIYQASPTQLIFLFLSRRNMPREKVYIFQNSIINVLIIIMSKLEIWPHWVQLDKSGFKAKRSPERIQKLFNLYEKRSC